MLVENVAQAPALTKGRADGLYPALVDVSASPGANRILRANGSGLIDSAWLPELTAYPLLAPAASTRNVIQSSGNYTPLTLKRNASGTTASHLVITDENGASLIELKADGSLEFYTIGGDPSITKMIYGAKTYVPVAAELYQGARFRPTLAPTVNTTATGYGGVFAPRYIGSGNVAEIYGVVGSVSLAGSGAVDAAYGFYGSISGTAANNVSNVYGAYLTLNQGAGATGSTWANLYGMYFTGGVSGSPGNITSMKAFYANPVVSGGGAITNAYGLYLENFNVASALNYAIYTNLGLVRHGDNVIIAGARSYASWTTSGKGLDVQAAILTDTSGSGTIASRVVNSFGIPTLAASNSETLTLTANLYVAGAPVAGSNVVQTAKTALLIDTGADAASGLVIRRNSANQSADIFQIQSSVGVVLHSVSPIGITTLKILDAVTGAVTNSLTLGHNSTGTPNNGFGLDVIFQAHTSTTVDTNAARIRATWATAAHATRKASLVLSVYDATAERDAITITTDGSNPTTTIAGLSAGQGLTLSGTSMGLDNGQRIFWKNSSGSYASAFIVDSSNNLAIRNVGGSILFQNSGANNFLTMSDVGTFTFRNPIASTGVTQLVVQVGAGQSGTDLIHYNLADASVVGSIGATGLATYKIKDAVTAAVTDSVIVGHNTSGTAANSYGTGLQIQGQSSTTADTSMARLRTLWIDAAHATRKARAVLSAYDTAERDAIAIEASGTAAMIGFLGAAPVIRQTTYTQTYLTTTATVNPASTSAFTGQDNAQAGTVYAKVADLNTLRTDLLMAMQLVNQLIDNLQAYGLAA